MRLTMRHRVTTMPPTVLELAPGQDGYLRPDQLMQLIEPTHTASLTPPWRSSDPDRSARFWAHPLTGPTTVALPGERMAKSIRNFTDHRRPDDFFELIRECSEYGMPRPSSYASLFRRRFHSPAVPLTYNLAFGDALAHGWEETLVNKGYGGEFPGVHYLYDLKSAYLAAAMHGLPDPRTYRRSLDPFSRRNRDGLYCVRLRRAHPGRPYPFNRPRRAVLVMPEEIALYDLEVAKVYDGVAWDRWLDIGRAIFDAVHAHGNTFAKQAARCFWGMWAQWGRIECYVPSGVTWPLANKSLNVVWAHVILHRVKRRLWDQRDGALQMYVDAVLRDRPIPGAFTDAARASIGDFVQKQKFDNGVRIGRAGLLTALDAEHWQRMTGVPQDSPRRRISASWIGEDRPTSNVETGTMPIVRNAPELTGFFKFSRNGQKVIGKVERFFRNDATVSPNMVLAPCLVIDQPGARPKSYKAVAIGLSTDLRIKIDEKNDVNAWLSLELIGTTPTNKGAARKNFHVEQLSLAEAKAAGQDADKTHRDEPYPNEVPPARTDRDAAAPASEQAREGEEDLGELPW